MNISFGQLVILLLLCILFFGDISYITKNINLLINNLKNYLTKKELSKKNRKKGT